ncbi:META domain-containing protein [Acetobacter cibinongensis]|uniref:META domain-containing protein n=1 Tax=Acetobacter cibinongensis TaxID=146475 RepID=UPI000A3B10FE|nr:META domain-containing protein [Acetobacter cibinongensis]
MQRFRLSSGLSGVAPRSGSRRLTPTLAALCLPGLLAACSPSEHQDTPPAAAATQTSAAVYQASGTEPSWHLTLAGSVLTFEPMGAAKVVRTITPAQASTGARQYKAQDMTVDITPKACTDRMSGQRFTETVSVTTQGRTVTGCGGDAAALTSLNNTSWIVTALNGKALPDGNRPPNGMDRTTDVTTPAAKPTGMAPTLDINASGKASGSDGCNRYVGGLEFGPDGKVKSSQQGGMSTLMACLGPNGAVSSQFNTLKRAVSHWRTEGTTLVLETSDKRSITLRKVL